MRQLLVIAFAIFSCSQIESSAGAERCPVTGGDARRAIIARAPSCQNAVRLFKRCATGASLDGLLALSVMKVCERSSLARMPAKERAAYEAAIDGCNRPYVLKPGTRYRSVAAHCRVDVMAQYDRRH
jgi:hypothetical protein